MGTGLPAGFPAEDMAGGSPLPFRNGAADRLLWKNRHNGDYEDLLILPSDNRLIKLIVTVFDGLFHCNEFFLSEEIEISRSFSGGQGSIVPET